MKADVRPYRAEDKLEADRLMGSQGEPGAVGVVAEVNGSIVGLAFASVTGEIEGQLLGALQTALTEQLNTPAALQTLGGRVIPPGLWDELRGMDEAKQIIERRVILPLAEPGLAARHAVAPPKAIVLFGPPGTGKTTFAKGIASRLGWPFVEIEPAEIGAEGADRQATLLADAFDLLLELPEAVVFVDEVEDIASIRHDERRVIEADSEDKALEWAARIPGARHDKIEVRPVAQH